jgi:predicted methyltransferase
MRMLNSLIPALLLLAPFGASAAPADIAAAVASEGRPAEALQLDASRRPVEVLRFLGLEKGDRALDLFAGTGYYSELMAKAVGPKGHVIAWNHRAPGEAAAAAWASLKGRAPNVSLVSSPATALPLAPSTFDFVLMHLVYHDAYWQSERFNFPRMDPDALLRQVQAATKPGGIVGVIDHVAAPGGDAREVVEKLHRIDPAVIRADFERAGFVFDGESDLLRMPGDDHSQNVFDAAIRGKTDRIVYRFRKPASK